MWDHMTTADNGVTPEEVGHGWTSLIKMVRSSLIDFSISTDYSSQDFYLGGPQFLNQDS